ncbi:MAG: hypothetical protein HOC28_05160 [Bacteroidetes Order II. Incertae sedis bacterium]|jgi:uncharacterized HhH-GPD family protein|nr:hypothetical protein [Bacteroidetes Order II. bacterium]MDG1753447.1 hypothetical protein [Rhodothermales bacterium]HAY36038.1 hypothetical protein [Bacteroidota bacterium]MBT4051594.1 hypothetical protein [Bacteroidetes Order II. bacterium]MBT4602500.1 hypothetical protein [Bacteroidetes Order II. bacterium]
MAYPKTLLDYGTLDGGLVRMMERFKTEGTLIGDEASDRFIMDRPEAALLGMLYDQRVRAEYAFTGPQRLMERLGHLDMHKIATTDLDELREMFAEKPAVHRFTNVMAERTRDIAQIIVSDYEGKTEKLWDDGASFDVIQKRLIKLPGFGKMKAQKMRFVLHYFGYRDLS